MKRRKFITKTAGSVVVFPALILHGCETQKEYDLLITGGIVYDGSGSPGREADVAVKGDSIVKIGKKIPEKKSWVIVEAGGMAVAPGFIDPHTHTDVHLLANPKAESKIRQGVTTEIGGNCGYSMFPLSDRMYDEYRDKIDKRYGVEVNWRDMRGFFNRLEECGMSLNYGTLLGQGDLRNAVMGPNDRPPTDDELQRMKRIVRAYMQAGVLGISTGLIYTPGCFAKTDELIELCRDVAKLKGVYATHIRSEEEFVLEAIEEALTISRETGVSLEISHLKANHKINWQKMDKILPSLTEADKDGISILADRYPYIASSTGLDSFFPLWAREGTTADFIARLRDMSLSDKLKTYIEANEEKTVTWDKVLLSSVLSEKNKHLEGKTILDAAAEANKTCYEFIRNLLIEEEGMVGMIKFGMSEDNLRKVLSHPLMTIGSDGNSYAPYGILSQEKIHPRSYGTFPRVLGKYVREEKILTLPAAVRKMTLLPAEKFGLTGRGIIAEGNFADIVVFDPDTVTDRATYVNPHQYPDGIVHVIVNGTAVISHSEHTGKLPGKILRKTQVLTKT